MKLKNQRPRVEAMENIENYIIRYNLKPDERLLSERTMCEMWGYNRSTLRSAIKQLILEGRIYNKNGAGTFVAKEKLVRNLQDADGFYQAVQKAGRNCSTHVIGLDFCEANKIIGKRMMLPLGHRLIRIIRLRYLDSIPVIISTAYLDAERFKGIEKSDLENGSLYGLMKERYGIEACGGEEKLSIAYCDQEEAEYLKIEVGSPVIYQTGVTLDQQDAVFEYFKNVTRSKYICFASELTRK